ncbi:hypothetical protein C8F04DRAFT_1402268 [Mycena alexandri]|uniref:Uncharacterized protein n=1 Tax=Mycena alexandri TaxID=1745969 RepID=A0AAD6S7K5_9AGAR|nr:hypothetical protein C8F04DRAFT_1402268 [Mycena alexandri]
MSSLVAYYPGLPRVPRETQRQRDSGRFVSIAHLFAFLFVSSLFLPLLPSRGAPSTAGWSSFPVWGQAPTCRAQLAFGRDDFALYGSLWRFRPERGSAQGTYPHKRAVCRVCAGVCFLHPFSSRAISSSFLSRTAPHTARRVAPAMDTGMVTVLDAHNVLQSVSVGSSSGMLISALYRRYLPYTPLERRLALSIRIDVSSHHVLAPPISPSGFKPLRVRSCASFAYLFPHSSSSSRAAPPGRSNWDYCTRLHHCADAFAGIWDVQPAVRHRAFISSYCCRVSCRRALAAERAALSFYLTSPRGVGHLAIRGHPFPRLHPGAYSISRPYKLASLHAVFSPILRSCPSSYPCLAPRTSVPASDSMGQSGQRPYLYPYRSQAHSASCPYRPYPSQRAYTYHSRAQSRASSSVPAFHALRQCAYSCSCPHRTRARAALVLVPRSFSCRARSRAALVVVPRSFSVLVPRQLVS